MSTKAMCKNDLRCEKNRPVFIPLPVGSERKRQLNNL